ncbi:MAG: hypothetical protein JW993_01835 [Sedimentisphaerales bacterium]|nr:hypothetical protein [Sedimentisphaerales bacterium]
MKVLYVLLFAALIHLLWCSSAHGQPPSEEQAAQRQSFEAEYEAWKRDCDLVAYSSRASDRLESDHFKNIVAMGPGVLPYLVERQQQDPDFVWAGWAWGYIARVNTDPAVNPWAKESIASWWSTSRKETPGRFAKLYSEWKTLKGEHKEELSKEKLRQIQSLGITGLPLMIQELHKGRAEFIPIISELTDGVVDSNSTPAQCLAWWESSRDKWLIPFPNGRPTAKVDPDKIAVAGHTVQLDGSASTDPDGDPLSYQWIQIGGPVVTLSDATARNPTFVAPQVTRQTVLVFQLVVDDAADLSRAVPTPNSKSAPSSVRITVSPTQ